MHTTKPKFIKISQMAGDLLHLTVFKTAVNRHLGFFKFEYLNNW